MTGMQRRLKYLATIDECRELPEDTDADFELRHVYISTVDSSGKLAEIVVYRFEDAPSRARRRVSRNGDIILSTV